MIADDELRYYYGTAEPDPEIAARCSADRAAGVAIWWLVLHARGNPCDVYALMRTVRPTDRRHALAFERAAGTLMLDDVDLTITPSWPPADPGARALVGDLPVDTATPPVRGRAGAGDTCPHPREARRDQCFAAAVNASLRW
jgi:hypothetical protein